MIRYRVTSKDWRDAINHVAPTWMDRAASRTAAYEVAGRYTEPPSRIWSDIKSVYMNLQGFKCGFCERRLEESQFGNVEHDIEHFRPKGRVTAWPPASAPERGDGLTSFSLGAPADPGYFLLAHNHENYLISCKTCNSALKRDGFPVDGQRQTDTASPRNTSERPDLVYPLGMLDDDPQSLIRFEGIVPVPAAQRGRRRRRGKVIISFFQLAERDGLLEERSMTIAGLHLALISIAHPDQFSRELAQATVQRMVSDSAAHANCARSFIAVWAHNRLDAEAFSQAALNHLESLP